MNPVTWFTTEDLFLSKWMERVAERRIELADEERADQAAKIANAVGKVFGG